MKWVFGNCCCCCESMIHIIRPIRAGGFGGVAIRGGGEEEAGAIIYR